MTSDDELFGPQPTPIAELGDPERVLRFLALAMVEVDEGARELDQIAHILDESVYRRLMGRAALLHRARLLERGPSTRMRPTITVGRIHARSPRENVLEAVVMVTYNELTRAVAVRLEGVDHRWRAMALDIL
ncbi:Rv3235 family protein [Naasia lichenicola]|uniref:3-hydroxyacyl-CoA dehydrogenase n=1 Tax=Naasia lichenicola TaxID=2565933 RepID=A0A4S4FQP7_9MICO|nr:3-hydroxyacyl-CoA dehydrogenase [Naasia lichenicola]THG31945.1 3-hydroxyacyl-CoA dehydrogenase [Naasia lichenicola]